MKTKKKLIAILLLVAILSSFIPNLISYAAEPSFTMNITGTTDTSTEVEVGDTVSVDFNLVDGLESQTNLSVVIEYDPDFLEPEPEGIDEDDQMYWTTQSNAMGTQIGSIVMATAANEGADGEIVVVAGQMFAGTALGTSGRIGTIPFKVKKGGETEISYSTIKYEQTDSQG